MSFFLLEEFKSQVMKLSKPERLKWNIDVAFAPEVNRTDIGVCVRDANGAYVLAITRSFTPMTSVDVREALDLHHAFQWLHDMRMNNVDFVVDSKTTVDAFNLIRTNITEFGQTIAACQDLFSSSFVNSKVEFNRRQTNEVAHALAREATRALLVSTFI